MAYTVERHGYQRGGKTPAAVRLIADWKRSCSARARLYKTTGSAGYGELHDLAVLWTNLHVADIYVRTYHHLPMPGDVPEWVNEHNPAD